MKRAIFFALWALTTIGLIGLVLLGKHDFDSRLTPLVLFAVFACTAALLWWLPGPQFAEPPEAAAAKKGWFVLILGLTVGVLFPLRTLVGPPLLFSFPAIAVIVLAAIRPQLARRDILYALGLALVAGFAGLGAGWITFVPLTTWAILQVALVATALPAGWSLLRRAGLWQMKIGSSAFLANGAASALKGFGQGILLAVPWALSGIVMGGSNKDGWVHSWWQPFAAIEPGIMEEACWRVFLVSLLFVVLRRAASTGTALTAAVVVMAYWFAYLHTPGGFDSLFSAVLIGTLYSLPISYLWLRRDLETAIGFHFWMDFVRFGVAYVMNKGLWFT